MNPTQAMINGLMQAAQALYVMGLQQPMHITLGMNEFYALQRTINENPSALMVPVQSGANWRGDQRITLLTPYMPIIIGGTWDVQV